MRNGDISNVVQPRVILVWEGALGFIDDKDVGTFNRLASKALWFEAWNLWSVNDLMARKVWDVVKRQNVNVSLVTYIAEDKVAASALQRFVDDARLPIGECFAVDPAKFARELSFMPDIACVYDPSVQTVNMMGSKGRLLKNVNDFCRF